MDPRIEHAEVGPLRSTLRRVFADAPRVNNGRQPAAKVDA